MATKSKRKNVAEQWTSSHREQRLVRHLHRSGEEHRHLYHPHWSVKEMEAIATLSHRHRVNPVELIRDAVGGWDEAWKMRHPARYILEDANPEKLAEACGLPLGVLVAALENILPNVKSVSAGAIASADEKKLKGLCPSDTTTCSESSFVDGVYQKKCLHPLLPDDPQAALLEVARFIRGMREYGAIKGFHPVGCKPAFIEGFIIDHAWLYELDGVADEAERVAGLHAHSGE